MATASPDETVVVNCLRALLYQVNGGAVRENHSRLGRSRTDGIGGIGAGGLKVGQGGGELTGGGGVGGAAVIQAVDEAGDYQDREAQENEVQSTAAGWHKLQSSRRPRGRGGCD